ncbi:hypothetical protein, partial [Candidatus Collinsella stercoripullorum]
MACQPSLFPSGAGAPDARPAADGAPRSRERWAGFVSVVVDIPARALSEPFAYAVPERLADDVDVACAVLVPFGRRA